MTSEPEDLYPEDTTVLDVDQEAYDPEPIPLYEDAFPPLTSVSTARGSDELPITTPAKAKPAVRLVAFRGNTKTEVLKIRADERRFAGSNTSTDPQHQSGRTNWETKQRRICQELSTKYQVSVEMNLSKEGTLTVFVTGRDTNVVEAKRPLLKALQNQTQEKVPILQEYHKAILGPKGSLLREIETQTSTNCSVPKPEDKSDFITVTGPKDNVEHAKQLLQTHADELARLGFERIPMEKIYHPLVFNRKTNTALYDLVEGKKLRLGVPPAKLGKNEVTVSGEKEFVQEAVGIIQTVHEKLKRDCQDFLIELPKEKHTYILGRRGAGRTEVLEKTGIVLDIPPQSDPSLTVRLFGPRCNLGSALTLVMTRAESMKLQVVPAPAWLHKYVIGKSGNTLDPITKGKEVTLSFVDANDEIRVEGKHEEVDQVSTDLTTVVKELLSRLAQCTLEVEPAVYKHLIGKDGAVVTRLSKSTGCALRFPSEPGDHQIRIEGTPDGVEKARKEILSIVERVENTKSKDVIVDHNLIPRLIGPKGKRIKDICEGYPKVRINFPQPNSGSDVVSVRGPRADVDAVAKQIVKAVNNLQEESYSESVYVAKEYHKNVVGRDGTIIRQLREETSTRIDLPAPGSNSEMIQVTGRRHDVRKAVQKLAQIQQTQHAILEVELKIPHSLHTRLIGRRGQRVDEVQKAAGGDCHVHFPGSDTQSDRVTIRGPRDQVALIQTELTKMAADEEEQYSEDHIPALFHTFRFIIGSPRGAIVRKVREESGAKIYFPISKDEGESIHLSGSKTAVVKAKEMLLKIIEEMGEIVTETVSVEPKWHRFFTKHRGIEIGNLSDNFNVRVTIPKSGTKSDQVRVEGPQKKVQLAIKNIESSILDLENTITEEVLISPRHRQCMVEECQDEIYDLCKKYNVEINLPPLRPQYPPKPSSPPANGHDSAICSDSSISGPPKLSLATNTTITENGHPHHNNNHHHHNGGDMTDVNSETSSTTSSVVNVASPTTMSKHPIILKGHRESIDKVKVLIMDFCPVDEEVSVPFEFHRLLIGTGGKTIRQLSQKHRVTVKLPKQKQKANYITVTGLSKCVSPARADVEAMVVKWKEEECDKRERNYTAKLQVPRKYHSLVIGAKGAYISQLRSKFEVVVNVPDQKSTSEEILIRGYQEKAEAAKRQIQEMVDKLESYVDAELVIDPKVHPRLIGSKGSGLERVRRQFGVEIMFPSRGATGDKASTVRLHGEAVAVDDCSDYLITTANEMLTEMEDDDEDQGGRRPRGPASGSVNSVTFYQTPASGDGQHSHKQQRGFLVREAPWQKKQLKGSPKADQQAPPPLVNGTADHHDSDPELVPSRTTAPPLNNNTEVASCASSWSKVVSRTTN